MPDVDLLERLTQHRALAGAPPGELAWLIAHGEPRSWQVGDVTTRRAQPEEWLQVILTGHLAIRVDRGAGARKIIEWRGGDVCGLMPYSRGGAPPGDTVVVQPTETLAISREHLPEMIRACPGVTAKLVHAMLDRARYFTASDNHDEKLISLGRLAAGLAHELNNPASAGVRSAGALLAALAELESAARTLVAAHLSDVQMAAIDGLRARCERSADQTTRSAVARADREEAFDRWLGAHAASAAPAAAPLAETDVTIETLDDLAHAFALADAGRGGLDAALRWIAASCQLRALADDIDRSSSRISDIVGAVKRFSYLDRAPALEPVDIRPGIMDTLAVLATKTRTESVKVAVQLAPDLPRVLAFGAELNQVWANLIDNALDAVTAAGGGHVEVSAAVEGDRVVVRVLDDGPGVPAELRGRIFDPFFTTKGVGRGTGLGLDIARRLVQRHDGEIDLDSRPGRTEFQVRLPAAAEHG